jgi:aryl-alcohol dehydrogenase-like predicted oxidoreductase
MAFVALLAAGTGLAQSRSPFRGCVVSGTCCQHGQQLSRRRMQRLGCMSVRLGQSDTYLSDIGAGTIAWGDSKRGYGNTFSKQDVTAAVRYLAAHGVNHFDCAEVYGSRSIAAGEGAEQLLGDVGNAVSARTPLIFASKYFPLPWTAIVGVGGGVRLGRRAVRDALRLSLTRMGRAKLDLYYLHFPLPIVPGIYDGLADCVNAGLIDHVGVSNHNVNQLKAAHSSLSARGIKLAANQFRYNLLDRSAEASGLLAETLDLGVTPVAYEPLAKGLLTGKYTDNQVSAGHLYSPTQLKLYKQLTSLMRFIGVIQGGSQTARSVTEVALAYCRAKSMVVIPGIKTEGQAREAIRSMEFDLDADHIGTLEEKVAYIKTIQGRL